MRVSGNRGRRSLQQEIGKRPSSVFFGVFRKVELSPSVSPLPEARIKPDPDQRAMRFVILAVLLAARGMPYDLVQKLARRGGWQTAPANNGH